MENLVVIFIIIGAALFGLFICTLSIAERFPSTKENKILKWLQDTFMTLFILCIPIVVILFFLIYANEPSAFEKCMSGSNKMTDPAAIAWMEDYCASQSYR
jgi:ABC-type amino acid transport system permease subunit